MTALADLARRLRGATFVQAARAIELAARRDGRSAEVGRDAAPHEEPVRFVASDRMALVAHDLANVEMEAARVRVTASILGLAGASPALPPAYSEVQLQRRRARDAGFARFLNLFDHRALSFFYRIAQKFRWPLLAEREGRLGGDPVAAALGALGGVAAPGVRGRLDLPDPALVTLTAHLGDVRRSAASVEAVLRVLTGLPLRLREGRATWMPVPRDEQTRLGARLGRYDQLGEARRDDDTIGAGAAAMIGGAVLDIQHHFLVDVGPLDYAQLRRFCVSADARRLVTQLCILAAGLEQRGAIRLLIAADDIPRPRLADASAPALLGWTTWLGRPATRNGIADDCVIPMDPSALSPKKAVVAPGAPH